MTTQSKFAIGSKFTGALLIITSLLSLYFYNQPLQLFLYGGLVLYLFGMLVDRYGK